MFGLTKRGERPLLVHFLIPGHSKVPQPVGNSSHGKQRRTKTRKEEAKEEEGVAW